MNVPLMRHHLGYLVMATAHWNDNHIASNQVLPALTDLVREFGYTLAPIQTPQEAHAAALARRVAEDRDFGQQDINLGR